MSDAAQDTISLTALNGRIAELEFQRNRAQTRAAVIAGEKAEALDLVRILKAEVERLTALLNDSGGPAAAVASTEPETPLAPTGAAAIAP
ncbi:hypothetical protein [Methylorubrum zatmanii]|uniref:DUF904 domain-containing protein n=1 Tax=Methylorubrum zatmanii TaxID=29429 RepID=A0ABW1WJF5_9HYPH|nr:hypothetical protein [Methylorubrum zatmanii]MBD8906531.1 hypothetical protein [Methylorubrum zatmanii]